MTDHEQRRLVRHIAEFEFERAVFGHSDPIPFGASAAFRRFAASID
jgi:hypothetical protein